MRVSKSSALSSSRDWEGAEEGTGWEGKGAEEGWGRKGRGGEGRRGVGNSRTPVLLGHGAESRHLVQIAPVDIFSPLKGFSRFLAHFFHKRGSL